MLDPGEPVTIGAMVGPEAFTEVKYLMHAKQIQALDAIPEIAADFARAFGRELGRARPRLPHATTPRRSWSRSARCSARSRTSSTSCATQGVKIGVVAIKCFRPYPLDEVRAALRDARRIVVLEKAFAVGAGGIVGQNVRLALSGLESQVHDVVAGLGGRPITKRSLHALFADVLAERLEPGRLHFLDLKREVVERELERMQGGHRPGPHAENILRDLGIVAAGSH